MRRSSSDSDSDSACSSDCAPAIASSAGISMKRTARSSAASIDSTSERSAGSSAQAESRKAARSNGFNSTTEANRLSSLCERSAIIGVLPDEFTVKPGFRKSPISHYRSLVDCQRLGDLLLRQPAEEPHLDNAT